MRKTLFSAALFLLSLATPHTSAFAAVDLKRCENHLSENKQPIFSPAAFTSMDAVQVIATTPPKLRLNTNTTALNPEKGIFFPFDQDVTISYVYESAGASHSLGWAYYDDLVAAGYINQGATPTDSSDDTLNDNDGNGVSDLHDDIYNTSSTRPYVGVTRRCTKTFTTNSRTYYEPELAKNNCSTTTWDNSTKFVGNSNPASADTGWSDNGLHRRIPNLLEPKDVLNGNMGLGHLLYLLGDDDGDSTAWNGLPPVADSSTSSDGVPDYDTSAYNSSGKPVGAANPDPGITSYDRTISMGTVKGAKEIVFFLVVYYAGDTCLRAGSSSCTIGLRTPISVFWSKSFMNMDLNGSTATNVTSVDIGCGYPGVCTETGSSQVGWLDNSTISRLNTAIYGNLVLPHEKVVVTKQSHGKMPHTIVGAPSTDPLVWILGFEDLNGGGDKDFNDVVFMINKKNNGGVRSGVVSGDISPSMSTDFTITNVRFKRDDDTTNSSFYEIAPHTTACDQTPKPSIQYEVAVDCNICTTNGVGVTTCANNPSPTWTPVVFPDTTPPTKEVVLDMTKLGFTGTQLCWRSIIESPDEFCQPTINSVEVGYQAIKSGSYSRAAVSPLANAVVYGGFEVLGKNTTPAPSVRVYDGAKDLSVRGHLYLKTLYDPSTPAVTAITQRWDAGLRLLTASLDARKLYTMGNAGQRLTLLDDLNKGNNSSLFPINSTENFCKNEYVDTDGEVNDVNRDGTCDANDRQFLYDWMFGWEDKSRAANVSTGPRRAWPMGQINLSTAAVIGPPSYPTWWAKRTDLSEKSAYVANFLNAYASRKTVAYVGTATGQLHGFMSGEYRNGDNSCTSSITEYRGYFKQPSCAAQGDYGTGDESFAYLPKSMLSLYVNSYTSRNKVAGGEKPHMDASPSVADIDLGGMSQAWKTNPTDPTKGGKTVLVSSTGPDTSTVFSLDITDPSASNYPVPMWEFDLRNTLVGGQTIADWFKSSAIPADREVSRHSPPIVRVKLKGESTDKWVALVASDYVPSSGTAGTVTLIDMATGLPYQQGNITNGPTGVVTLGTLSTDLNEGVAGEPTPIDFDEDGIYDVVYVPSTSGKVYRLNLNDISITRGIGKKISVCELANAPADVAASGVSSAQAALQRIHSNVAARAGTNATNAKVVQLFFGTGDNPDNPYDAQATNYYVMGYEDSNPFGAANAQGKCSATKIKQTQLDLNQVVWGGVVMGKDDVYVTTAVGGAADACNLDQDEGGKLYSLPTNGNTVQSQSLDDHGINAPVIYDEHLFVITAGGAVQAKGKGWNNKTGGNAQSSTQVLMWEELPKATLPK